MQRCESDPAAIIRMSMQSICHRQESSLTVVPGILCGKAYLCIVMAHPVRERSRSVMSHRAIGAVVRNYAAEKSKEYMSLQMSLTSDYDLSLKSPQYRLSDNYSDVYTKKGITNTSSDKTNLFLQCFSTKVRLLIMRARVHRIKASGE